MLDNYLHAIALGSTDAMYELAVLYLNNHYGEENRASGLTLLTQAASAEHSDAAMFLAHLYYTGDLVDQDLDQARTHYVQAAELENNFARKSYARFLLDRSIEQEVTPDSIRSLLSASRLMISSSTCEAQGSSAASASQSASADSRDARRLSAG